MSPRGHRAGWPVSHQGLALLGALVFTTVTTTHAVSSTSFLDVKVTVIRSCRISTDSLAVDGTPLSKGCTSAAAAPPEIHLGPAPPRGDRPRSTTEGLIASARPVALPELSPQRTILRLTIDF